MDQNHTRQKSYALPTQATTKPKHNSVGPPNPKVSRPHPTVSQPSTSKIPHIPHPEGREKNNLHNLASSSEEMLETQPVHHNGWQQIRQTKCKILQDTVSTVLSPQTVMSNRYEMLADESFLPEDKESAHPNKINKSPPIFLHGVLNYSEMMKSLTDVAEEEQFYTKSLANNVIKLVCLTPDTYRKKVTHCQENDIYYHTYQLKEERAFRVVLKYLHHSSSIDDIKQELRSLGHAVRNIINIIHRTTKEPLNIFFMILNRLQTIRISTPL
jgi:hypothetical protein